MQASKTKWYIYLVFYLLVGVGAAFTDHALGENSLVGLCAGAVIVGLVAAICHHRMVGAYFLYCVTAGFIGIALHLSTLQS